MSDKQDPMAAFEGLQIHWRDGLPKDRAEESTIEATLATAGLTSRYSAIKRLLDGNDVAALEELERIREEQLEDGLDTTVAAQGKTPPADDFDMSKQLAVHLRGAQGGGVQSPEEGGPKPR